MGPTEEPEEIAVTILQQRGMEAQGEVAVEPANSRSWEVEAEETTVGEVEAEGGSLSEADRQVLPVGWLETLEVEAEAEERVTQQEAP